MGAVLGFKLGTRLFANPRVPKALRHVKLLLKELKEIVSFERKQQDPPSQQQLTTDHAARISRFLGKLRGI